MEGEPKPKAAPKTMQVMKIEYPVIRTGIERAFVKMGYTESAVVPILSNIVVDICLQVSADPVKEMDAYCRGLRQNIGDRWKLEKDYRKGNVRGTSPSMKEWADVEREYSDIKTSAMGFLYDAGYNTNGILFVFGNIIIDGFLDFSKKPLADLNELTRRMMDDVRANAPIFKKIKESKEAE